MKKGKEGRKKDQLIAKEKPSEIFKNDKI